MATEGDEKKEMTLKLRSGCGDGGGRKKRNDTHPAHAAVASEGAGGGGKKEISFKLRSSYADGTGRTKKTGRSNCAAAVATEGGRKKKK